MLVFTAPNIAVKVPRAGTGFHVWQCLDHLIQCSLFPLGLDITYDYKKAHDMSLTNQLLNASEYGFICSALRIKKITYKLSFKTYFFKNGRICF